MGIHGNSTCVMNYDEAEGTLLGEANGGLKAMFTMMNEARLGVGLQGLSLSEVAYQNAVAYAKDRLQGRSLSGPKAPDKKADPIIVHPDIRRSLMTMKAFNEAGRALALWTAIKSDIAHRSGDDKDRQAADDYTGLMTPVVKGVLTDKGFDHAVMAQQVFGGHGYIEEHGMSQFVRDARIAMIYEGANGIQALDLVGRKLGLNGGRAVQAFFKEVGEFCEENRADEKMAPFTKALKKGLNDLQAATMWLMQNGMAKPDNAGAASTDYMHLFGLVALGYMWAQMAKAALGKTGANGSQSFYDNKLVTARFFMERIMPETSAPSRPHFQRRRHADGAAGGSVLSLVGPAPPAHDCRNAEEIVATNPAEMLCSAEARLGGGRGRHALRHGASLHVGGDRAALRRVREERDGRPRELAEGRCGRPALRLDAGGIWRLRRHLRA